MRVNLGQFAVTDFANPLKDKRRREDAPSLILELKDNSAYGLKTSEALAIVQERLLPHPVRYRQVWNFQSGTGKAKPLYAWQPIPPTSAFVAMGKLVTVTDDPPPLNAVRCVPRSWVVPSPVRPTRIWDDR